MTLPVVFTANGPSGYNLTKSLRFRSSASAYLNRNQSSGNSQTFTWSGWIKRGKLGAAQDIFGTIVYPSPSNQQSYFSFNSDDTFHIDLYSGSSYFGQLYTSQVFRDPSAWYHIVVAFDTTQSTASNRIKLYVNGSQITAFGTANYPSQNANTYINNSANSQVGIGRVAPYNDSQYFDGYMAEMYFIDGQALTPSSFGSTNSLTGVWQPAKYTGTYGTNGFYLPFTNTTSTTTLGYDFSGNGNNWTTNNISLTSGSTYDSMTDVPTLTSATTANTATINPLDYVNSNTGSLTATNGNLLVTRSTTAYGGFPATIALPTSGKFAFEFTASQAFNGSTNEAYFGIGVQSNGTFTNSSATGTVSDYYTAVNITGGTGAVYKKFSGGSSTSHYAGTGAVGSGDVFQFLVDMTNGTIDIKKNGSTYGTQVTGLPTTIPLYPYISLYGSVSMSVNFGQQPFASTPTSGYVALNTYNLPTSTIVKGNTVMDATLYTGTGATQSIVNAAPFKPDFVWIKDRSNAANNCLIDSNRGVDSILFSDLTAAQDNDSGYGIFTSFNSNGFTVGNGSAQNYGSSNANGQTYVGWQWQAGQGTTSSNTNGSITSTVSVNASAGFSVATFTTASSGTSSVGHGLGVTPSFVIFKTRSTTSNWICQHTSTGTQYLVLNGTGAATTDSTVWNSAPTSSIVNLGTGFSGYGGATAVMYCWAEIAGFSKFGSYTGNGSTDGTFVYTGFRLKFVLMKATSGANDWIIYDTVRNTYNLTNYSLCPDSSAAENGVSTTTENTLDILSNGFKLRTSNALTNGSSVPYIYAAFAENPFKNALAR